MKIGVLGCAGRMGRMLVREISETAGCELAGGTEKPGSEFVGQDVAALAGLDPAGSTVSDVAASLFAAADAVVDFTVPATAADHARLASEHGVALVIGTTGLKAEHHEALRRAAARVAVVEAANTSVCVTLMLGLTQQVAGILGTDYDIEISEMHHRHKVDAPSGTALALGRAAAAGRGVDLDDVAQRVRDGETGPRRPGDIGFATLRGGDVVGTHTVIFAGEGECIELTHRTFSRAVFARGAVRAALWTTDKPPGLYSMGDVLGLS